jgi:hypothetical protein
LAGFKLVSRLKKRRFEVSDVAAKLSHDGGMLLLMSPHE